MSCFAENGRFCHVLALAQQEIAEGTCFGRTHTMFVTSEWQVAPLTRFYTMRNLSIYRDRIELFFMYSA